MIFNKEEFYPTPVPLLDRITKGVNWTMLKTVLEPEAGKGDIALYIKEKGRQSNYRRDEELDLDCVEIDPELRSVLKGKGLRVVHDDFLTMHTFKRYDLIIMNPPFSNGEAHLERAIQMQKDGGNIICILNAETIRNPYTNQRKALVNTLNKLEADIEFLRDQFVTAERPTGVEIAVVKICIPEKERVSFFYEDMRKKVYDEKQMKPTDVAPGDFVDSIIANYNLEVSSGIRLIQEYKAMQPYLRSSIKDSPYNPPILDLKMGKKDLSINGYVRLVRRKYWEALFKSPKITGKMTSNLLRDYLEQVNELAAYDFSHFNIYTVMEQMNRSLLKGIEDCILEIFDKLSYQYSYSDELSGNIHYYNGWCTNKAWYINKKVILPYFDAYDWFGNFRVSWESRQKLGDIEKALEYLNGGTTDSSYLNKLLDDAEKEGKSKNIQLKYFTVTFYKKRTCHLVFTNEDLLKKLNIFGGQQKKWLPPGYGKRKYRDFSPQEKQVVDSFDGSEQAYGRVLARADYFVHNPQNLLTVLNPDEVA